MPFAPAVPFTGLAGLRFLDRTYQRQFGLFSSSPDIERSVGYFLENGAKVRSLDDLMGDRRLLTVVLGAFGLDDDIDKRAFVRKVLEEGTVNPRAFANRLVEPAYRQMSEVLGFGDVGGYLFLEETRQRIADDYRARQFELGVGEQDLDLRLAMNFRREAVRIVEAGGTERTMWLKLLGSQPVRSVVEGALGLPASFASLDLDRQIDEISDRAVRHLGRNGPSALTDHRVLDDFVERFLLNSQLANGQVSSTTRGLAALTVLQSADIGTRAAASLFTSNFL